MTADLESAHRQGCVEDCASGPAELGETDEGGHEKNAVGSDKEELDEGEGYGVAKLIHDGFSGVGRHGGGSVPNGTLEDESEGGRGRNGRCGGSSRGAGEGWPVRRIPESQLSTDRSGEVGEEGRWGGPSVVGWPAAGAGEGEGGGWPFAILVMYPAHPKYQVGGGWKGIPG